MEVRLESWKEINPQLAPPLFSYIPAEIRVIIFGIVLAETPTSHPNVISCDLGVRYGHGSTGHGEPPAIAIATWESWLRPDVAGPSYISCELLRTCRRIYLETAHLPVLNKEIPMYQGDRFPPWLNRANTLGNLEKTLASHHAASRTVRRLRIFSNSNYVESSFPRTMVDLHAQTSQGQIVSGIRTLCLTMRSNEWKGSLQTESFSFDPFVSWTSRSLAEMLPMMTNLSTLVMDFESDEDRRAELEQQSYRVHPA